MSHASVTSRHAPIQLFAAAFGLVYLLVAVWGWSLTGLHGDARMMVFHTNPLHNASHTVIAVAALAASVVDARVAALALTVLGAVLGLVTVLGFLNLLGSLGMHQGIGDPDNFLHLVTGAAGLIAGLLFGPEDDAAPETSV